MRDDKQKKSLAVEITCIKMLYIMQKLNLEKQTTVYFTDDAIQKEWTVHILNESKTLISGMRKAMGVDKFPNFRPDLVDLTFTQARVSPTPHSSNDDHLVTIGNTEDTPILCIDFDGTITFTNERGVLRDAMLKQLKDIQSKISKTSRTKSE